MRSARAGQRMRRVRTERGLVIAAIAARAGCSPGLIVSVEKHGHVPTPGVRRRLAAAIGVPVGTIWPEAEVAMT